MTRHGRKEGSYSPLDSLDTKSLLAPSSFCSILRGVFGNSLVFPARRLGRHLMPIRITCSRTRWS